MCTFQPSIHLTYTSNLSTTWPTGQIELYTHIPVMRQVVDQLQRWNFRLCGVFLLDSQFLIQASKFLAGVMTALSAMVTLELPHVNVLSKMDLLDKKAKKEIEKYTCLCYNQPSSSFSHTSPPLDPPPAPPPPHTHTHTHTLSSDT